nr:hypothetical protein [Neobacillus sp. Marseille-Q6967]
MLWLLISMFGLIIVILAVRNYYVLNKDIQDKKKRGVIFIFCLIGAVASESTILYVGLLLILFGIAKAAGLL